MDPDTHEQMMSCQDWIGRALRLQTNVRRHDDVGWEQRELDAVLLAANEWAVRKGGRMVTADEIKRADSQAVGHVDWASKLCLYVAEMVYDVSRLSTR